MTVSPWELSTILWRERDLVGKFRRGPSTRVELHTAEVDRAVVVNSLARVLDLEHDVTLRELADRLPEPWPDVFGSHHAALAASDSRALPRSLAEFLR